MNVVAPENQRRLAFLGASTLIGKEGFAQAWVTRAEYTASGVNIVNQKCY